MMRNFQSSRIAVIGAGNIGGTLGKLWADAGHQVVFGAADPAAVDPLLAGIDGNAAAATVSVAIDKAAIVLVAIPFGAWPSFGNKNAARLADKVVIDATNPDPGRDGAIAEQALSSDDGSLLFVTEFAPAALLVKAFNTMQASVLRNQAHRAGARLAYAIAGDHTDAVELVAQLVEDAGFDPVLVGNARTAKRFDRGTSVWNNPMTADELTKALDLSPT